MTCELMVAHVPGRAGRPGAGGCEHQGRRDGAGDGARVRAAVGRVAARHRDVQGSAGAGLSFFTSW